MRTLELSALATLTIVLTGCCNLKKLHPAFQANQQNIRDLNSNVLTILDLLEKSSTSLLDTRIELLRGKVADAIITEFGELGFSTNDITAAAVEKLLSNPTSGVGKHFAAFRDAINAADTQRREQLRFQFPVFAAILDLRVTPKQIAEDYAALLNARSAPNVRELKKAITDKYPAIRELHAARQRFSKAMASYRHVVVDQQLGLALQHADLFNYAAEANLNIEKAFASVIGDKGLQTQILGAAHDSRARESLEETFTLVTRLLESEEP